MDTPIRCPRRVGKCRTRVYCSKQCQSIDWKERHKDYCGKSGEINIDYEIKPSPGKGLGVFAKRPFKINEVIIAEQTLYCTAFDKMTKGQKEALLALSAGPDWHWIQRFDGQNVSPGPLDPWYRTARLMAINGTRTDMGPAICINISRVNLLLLLLL